MLNRCGVDNKTVIAIIRGKWMESSGKDGIWNLKGFTY
jgi:hypothetical protein